MTLATDKPRFTITVNPVINSALESYCEYSGDSKSQVIEKVLRVLFDLSIENRQALIKWAENEYRNPEDQARLILEKAISQWAKENKDKLL
ncbi:MAG: hypothetical protein MH252_04685 [Thermosynechococcaceae cyanobacterium MS004]|nr:hypothetical protein [Thermosynechococcaceae cyanobacterium MS004]